MIIEQANYVEGYRIDDVWRDAMWLCIIKGYDFLIREGSFKGQIRRQLPYITIRITKPGERPLAPYMPPSLSPPTTDEKIEKYFYEYLLDDKLKENEQYTYGSYIKPQLGRIIDILLEAKGDTNQASISIGDRDSVNLSDPPCLRVINLKVVEGKLNMSLFFRSWDLYGAMLQNLGGLQHLKEYVLLHLITDISMIESGKNIADGEIIAFSDGLHIYDHFFDLANMLNIDKIKVDEKLLKEKEDFGKKLDDIQ